MTRQFYIGLVVGGIVALLFAYRKQIQTALGYRQEASDVADVVGGLTNLWNKYKGKT